MKKLLLFLSLISCLSSLTGCQGNDDKINLTFGTYIENAVKLTYEQLSPKMLDEENMIVVVFPGEDSTCGCWTVFEDIMDDVVNKYHYQIYKISYAQFLAYGNPWNFPIYNDRPSLCFVENGQIKTIYEYDTRNVHPLFKNEDDFVEIIKNNCNLPNYYYIDEVFLENQIQNKNDFLIGYTWSSCPDCAYSFPNVLYNFNNNQPFTTKMYIIDLEVEGLLLENGIKDSSNPNYRAFVDKYSLSNTNDKTFGYDRGFVPTYQYYEDGILKDMCVYFNDAIEKIDNNYVITRSYYSDERIINLSFFRQIENSQNYILQGKILDEDELIINGDSISWKQENASVYHTPILEAFLNNYAYL